MEYVNILDKLLGPYPLPEKTTSACAKLLAQRIKHSIRWRSNDNDQGTNVQKQTSDDELIKASPAHPDLVSALICIANQIGKIRLLSSPESTGKPIKGRRHPLDVLMKQLDPVMPKIFSVYSMGWTELLFNQIRFPLSMHVKSFDDCKLVSENFRRTFQALEKTVHNQLNVAEYDEDLQTLANLLFLADLFDDTHSSFSNNTICWCNICFRRTVWPSKYCTEHTSSAVNKEIDTAQRKGKRIRTKSIERLAHDWVKIRVARRLLGDDIKLLSDDASAPDCSAAIKVNDVLLSLKVFCSDTINREWATIRMQWDALLDLTPYVRRTFSMRADSFTSWDEFRLALLSALKNVAEKSSHPYWIVMMLCEANDWFAAEEYFNDGRLTDTRKNALELLKLNPEMKIAEIGKALSITRQGASKLLKTVQKTPH